MIRQVYRLDRGTMLDCFYVANQFIDAQNVINWQSLEFTVQAGHSIMFVDESSNGFLKGFLVGNIQSKDAMLDALYVDRKFQRGGVGGALLGAYEDYVRKFGVKQIKLQSRPTKQAIEFYQKHGFQKIGSEYRMQKSL